MEYIDSKYFSYADPDDPWYRQFIIRTIESLAGQPALFKLYREYQENPNNWDSFWHEDGRAVFRNIYIGIEI